MWKEAVVTYIKAVQYHLFQRLKMAQKSWPSDQKPKA
jgi:hypothetical protein